VLEDAVAFIASDKDADVLPPGFVPYTLDELLQLFGDECLSADSLRSVHRVKKHDRTIKDVQL